jgi:CMP-N,N'-diacetyllegionaminic acid synthase
MNTAKTLIGIIAARSGSKGIKNKNFLSINKKNIVKKAYDIAIQIKELEKIIITSDSKKILNLVPNSKKNFKIKRSKKLALDNSAMLPVLKDAIIKYEKKYSKKIDAIIIFDPTSPLRINSDISGAIAIFLRKKVDLVVSAHSCQHNPYFSMLEKKGKYFKLLKNKNKNPGSRQEVPRVYEINTLVWIYSRNAIIKEKKRIPKKTVIFMTPYSRSIDINTQDDVEKIKFYLKKNEKIKTINKL